MQVCSQQKFHRSFLLQSDWLHIHVTTAAAGQSILAISFIAAIIYLVKFVDQSQSSKRTFWLEIIMYTLVSTIGFVIITSTFAAMDYKANFDWVDKHDELAKQEFNLPALVGPHEGELMIQNDLNHW